ncbi:hypothetical protein A5787_06950 [Mycobacterium sp. 852002-50816_SCH5313054-b]|uniref:hypothetical protein n=1 Tax=Mycobacterium sp. 852002-50816_SCH5313054-b TaxID=1834092 RepID=UPI0007FE3C00|nr:hypothetical protein [Mycobacterium sp. 852002-50816_SCH5313054-b]OBF52857.1 hypothetical protein A5787_06950 [Mycobacterium sp. 852002-50816_SCH5313054-b]
MGEHDELVLDPAGVGPQQEPTAPAAEDQLETTALPADAPVDLSRRPQGMVALIAAVACTVAGSRLIVIWALGSPVPLLDQWNGEGQRVYGPYLRGTLSFADLFTPHNSHRIFIFRLLSLVHLELAGEWNTRLEMIFGAIALTAVATWLAALLMPLVAPQCRLLLACFVAFVFAFPIGYENVLSGFQSMVYISLLFAVAALVAFGTAQAFSLRWFGGLVAAVLSCLSFAAGVSTVLAVGLLVGLQLATKARKRCGRELAGVVVIASIAVAMILWEASGANPLSTPWTFIEGLVLFTARIILPLIPTVWFCWHTLARRPAISDHAWVALGIAGWVAIQVVLLAYGRGNLVAPRYLDMLLLAYPVGLVAVLTLAGQAQARRPGRVAGPLAATWVFILVAMVAAMGGVGVLGSIKWSEAARQQEVEVKAYLATHDVDHLRAKDGPGLEAQLYFPTQQLAEILADPDVREVLPPQFRPPGADIAKARNRMWLKGSLAKGTAAAVHVILLLGPVLLAVGVSLFFAVGSRRSLPAAEGDAGVTSEI